MRALVLIAAVALNSCAAPTRVVPWREALDPRAFGLTAEEWTLCKEHFGNAGNIASDEAEWCRDHKDQVAGTAEQKKRAEDERAAASAREAEERRRQREQEDARQREEDQRRAWIAAEEQRRAAKEAEANSPAGRRIAWSALLCVLQEQRAKSKAAIAEERKYAEEGGGIVDMAKLYKHQTAIRLADHGTAASSRELKSLHVAALPCTEPTVNAVADCHRTVATAQCNDDLAGPYLKVTKPELDRLEAEVAR